MSLFKPVFSLDHLLPHRTPHLDHFGVSLQSPDHPLAKTSVLGGPIPGSTRQSRSLLSIQTIVVYPQE